jgi:hypothetical protein
VDAPLSWPLISSTLQYLFGFLSLHFSSKFDHLAAFLSLSIFAVALIFGRWKQNFPFLVAALIFWLEIAFYSLLKTPIFFYRILLPGLVPFVGFVALQIATIEMKKPKIISAALLLILSLVFAGNWAAVGAKKPVEYYQQVGRLIESEWRPNSLVVVYPGFISDTVSYYLKNTPEKAELAARNAGDLDRMKSDINESISQINREELKAVFLVSALSLGVDEDKLNRIFSAIKSEIKVPLVLKSFLIMSHDFTFARKLDKLNNLQTVLATLESQFGKPTFYKDEKVYVLSEYKLPGESEDDL